MSMNRQLSIIIPVHNVARYLQACLESIFRQGLAESQFEIILIDDGSSDGSIATIQPLADAHSNISILRQEASGPSVSRNNGMSRATGEYILFVDADDLLMDGGLKLLLPQAINTGADLVMADFTRIHDEEIAAHYEAQLTDAKPIDKRGIDYYADDFNPDNGFIWRILYRRAFLRQLDMQFTPGVYYEDIPFIQKCCLCANRVIHLHLLYYIYRIRPRSCTYSFTMKNAYDYNTAIASLWQLTLLEQLPRNVRQRLVDNIFRSFNYAVSCIVSVFSDKTDRQSIVSDLRQKAPHLQFHHGVRQRLVSFAFSHFPDTYILWCRFSMLLHNWLKARVYNRFISPRS